MNRHFSAACSLLLSAALSLTFASGCAEETAEEANFVGTKMEDFSFTTIAGKDITLSGLLEQNDAVYVNFFFDSCYWCGLEFPVLEKAWENNRDHIAVVAINPFDDADEITEYAEEMGLTFDIVADGESGLNDKYAAGGYPTSLLINKEGTICWTECGAMINPAAYQAMFDDCAAKSPAELENYVIPPVDPVYPAADSAALCTALGGDTAFTWMSGGSDTMAAFTPGAENEGAFFQFDASENALAALIGTVSAKAGDTISFQASLLADGLTEENGSFMYSIGSGDGSDNASSGNITEGENTYSYTVPTDGDYQVYVIGQTIGLDANLTVLNALLTPAN